MFRAVATCTPFVVSRQALLAWFVVDHVRIRAPVRRAAAMVFCVKCGEKVGDDVRFCPACGTAVVHGDPVSPIFVFLASIANVRTLSRHLKLASPIIHLLSTLYVQ